MGSLSVWHWLIFLAIVLLFFGGSGKISAIWTQNSRKIESVNCENGRLWDFPHSWEESTWSSAEP